MKKLLAVLALLIGASVMSQAQCAISTTTLPQGTVGIPYSASILSTCGNKKSLARLEGYPPLGLNISGSTGAVSGTPALAGTYYFKMQVSGTQGTATQIYYVTIVDTLKLTTWPQPVPIICGQNLIMGLIQASGGTPPYTWSATGLPPGLSMDTASGVLLGVPQCASTPGSITYTVNVRVTDTANNVAMLQMVM